jgi:hypothetical protein
MRLVVASLVLGQTVLSYQIINDARSQIQFLRVRRKNSGFFEEAKDDNYDRECVEEMCSYEELLEINEHNDGKAQSQWEQLTKKCYQDQCNAQGTKLCVQTWNKRDCHCKKGWTKTLENDDCSLDIDECDLTQWVKTDEKPTPCTGEQVCINNDGGYRCDCASGYKAGEKNGTCVNIDECAQGHECGAHSTCKDLPGSVTCECHTGYFTNEETNQCEDDDECAGGGADCPANSECSNTDGSYECLCNDGFSMNDDTSMCDDINECDEGKDCGHGQCTNNVGKCFENHFFLFDQP